MSTTTLPHDRRRGARSALYVAPAALTRASLSYRRRTRPRVVRSAVAASFSRATSGRRAREAEPIAPTRRAAGRDCQHQHPQRQRLLDFEWFASPQDLCLELASLAERSHFDASFQLVDLLALHPGLHFDPTVWPYVGYIGGSEPGVLSMS